MQEHRKDNGARGFWLSIAAIVGLLSLTVAAIISGMALAQHV